MFPPTPHLSNTNNGTPETVQVHAVGSDEDESYFDPRQNASSPLKQVDGATALNTHTESKESGSGKGGETQGGIATAAAVADGGANKPPDELNQSFDLTELGEEATGNQSDKGSLYESEEEAEDMEVEREKRKQKSPVKTSTSGATRSSKRKKKGAASNKSNDK